MPAARAGSRARDRVIRGVTITYSTRMSRSLARTYPARREIRLHPALKDGPQALLDELMAHELAHIAVYERHGHSVRPHGPEWRELIRAAGYEPRTCFTIADVAANREPAVAGASVLYDHRCPMCGMVRTARRPTPRWRCAECVGAGLEGKLEITTRPGGATG